MVGAGATTVDQRWESCSLLPISWMVVTEKWTLFFFFGWEQCEVEPWSHGLKWRPLLWRSSVGTLQWGLLPWAPSLICWAGSPWLKAKNELGQNSTGFGAIFATVPSNPFLALNSFFFPLFPLWLWLTALETYSQSHTHTQGSWDSNLKAWQSRRRGAGAQEDYPNFQTHSSGREEIVLGQVWDLILARPLTSYVILNNSPPPVAKGGS